MASIRCRITASFLASATFAFRMDYYGAAQKKGIDFQEGVLNDV